MAILRVAAKANPALLLPTILVAAYAGTLDNSSDIVTEIEDVECLGPEGNILELRTPYGTSVAGDDVLRHLRSSFPVDGPKVELTNEWVTRSADLSILSFKSLDSPLKELDAHLTLRSHVVGYSLTAADLAVWGALRGNRVALGGLQRASNNITRWYRFIEDSNPWIANAVSNLYAESQRKRAIASASGGSYNIGLQNTENGVVTRFPPEPSGYLHVGHAKAAWLNHYFAHEQADGTLICRFDDTNPTKESQEFQDAIKQDLSLMGIIPDRMSFSSDYFRQMYDLCVQLIKNGKAYADDTEKEAMQDERGKGIASKCRDMSMADTLKYFEEMRSGSDEGLRWCVRAKISVDNPNKAMRDPVIYRCNLEPHHRTGTAWKMYPTYDFCAPVLDSLEGVTHALRTNEYRDRNPQYTWMQDALGLRQVMIWDFARMNFIRTLLSKRKLTKLVDHGLVWGWDDPRMPTVRGIRRRGMTIPALREFILKQGPSRNIVNLDWTSFWATNKKYIDPVAPRYTAVFKEDLVTATVEGAGDRHTSDVPKHIKNHDLGTKKMIFSRNIVLDQADAMTFKLNEEITLMKWGNAFVHNIESDPTSKKVTSLSLRLNLQGDVKSTDKKITWLAQEPCNLLAVELVDFDYLITKDKIEKDEDFMQFLNPKTEFRTAALADCNVGGLDEGDIVQFERKGYFRLDRAAADGQAAVFFTIPTGKVG